MKNGIARLALFVAVILASPVSTAASIPDGNKQWSQLQSLTAAIYRHDVSSIVSSPQSSSDPWGLIIVAMVGLVCASVVYLCYLAVLSWSGYWKAMAFTPIIVLSSWLVLIVISKLIHPSSHNLWTFELFAWAMLTVVYLVILMTAKRAYEKADQGH